MDDFLLSQKTPYVFPDGEESPYLSSFQVLSRRFWRGQTIDVVEELSMGTRALYFMSRLIQSRMDLKDPVRLVLPYSRHMMAALIFLTEGDPQRVLMIGLGGGSLAKFILRHFPQCQLDIVEVDDGMEAVARTFFGLPEDSRMRIHVADGAVYLQNAAVPRKGYDLVLVDAFDHRGMARTVYARHFFQNAKNLIHETGIIVTNMTKSDGVVYTSASQTLKSLFPNGMLRLPVRASRNEILFCSPRFIPRTDWTQAKDLAKTLEQRFSLDFGQFLQDIQRFSSPFWSSGINF